MAATAKRIFILAITLLAGSCSVPPNVVSEPVEAAKPSYAETVEAEFEVLGHVGDPSRLRWADLDVEPVALSCIDGRASEGVVGTPGGDAGELLLLLAAAEAEGEVVDVERTPAWIDAWIAEFGPFYMHTDIAALAALGRALAGDPRFAAELRPLADARGELDLDRFEAWLRSAPANLHEPLLAHLLAPDAVGCGHLRSMLRAPADYGVRPALAGAVIVGVYRRLWSDPASVRFVVLRGEHHERAILDLEVEDREAHEIPLVVPSNAHDQVFVIQPSAVAVVRERAVELLAEDYPALAPAAVYARMQALGAAQLDATIAHLGVHVPTIRVVVDHDGTRSIAALPGTTIASP